MSGVRRRGNPCFFRGILAFCQRARIGGSGWYVSKPVPPCHGTPVIKGVWLIKVAWQCLQSRSGERTFSDVFLFVRSWLGTAPAPGSCHLHGVLSQGGSIGPCDHSPLSESSGELSGNHSPSAPPVCHLGLPGSAEMADSRMASPAAEPGRLSIASIGMKHIERNYNTGTQILPGSISGFYHRDRYQTARQLLERVFRARFIEIVDLRPLKDAANYPDLRGHMGWNSTNVLLDMHDRSLRDIADRPFTAPGLAAQCEIPPHIAQYPFEIVSQRGVSHPFALFS